MEKLQEKHAFICDMDGVIYHGNHLLTGVKQFLDWLKDENKQFLFLTNSTNGRLVNCNRNLTVSESAWMLPTFILVPWPRPASWRPSIQTAAHMLSERPGSRMPCTKPDFP